ncbi:uncharacterized protein LOC141819359 [Curcuma longa]|uniref:uncharacterized protein LOC141819359 n=1 Tax=Curcuma longa TaxID=136217 RepID=UPI003D9F0BAA
MKMQETQIAQISSSLSSRQVGALLGKPDFHPMEHCKAIELRSGQTLKGKEPQVTAPLEDITCTSAVEQPPSSTLIIEDEWEEVETDTPAEVPSKKTLMRNIPFSQRLLYKQKDDEFEKLYNRVKDITLGIPLLDSLSRCLSLSSSLRAHVHEEYNSGQEYCGANRGRASVSIIPYSISEKYGYTDLKLTTMAIQLADHSCRYPMEIIEDVPVEVGGFTVPIDFVVLDMEKDPSILIILGRLFLATAGAKIDVKNHKLSLEVGNKKVEFNFALDSNAYLPEKGKCYRLDDT